MIIDNIVINNFCIYKGRHSLELSPVSNEKPVILIGALNGAGKTTLLDAIQLCLFGPFAKCSKKGKRNYKNFLKNCINKYSDEQKASISLSFRHFVEGHEEHFQIVREWSENNSLIDETLTVYLNGVKDALLSDNWNSEVSKLFPASIAELFLFDGEKIESYADKVASSNMIKTAIEGLLGIDIIEQLGKDLKTFEKKTRLSEADVSAQKDISDIETQLSILQKEINDLKQKKAHTFTHNVERGTKKLEELKSSYEKKGGRLYENRREIEVTYNSQLTKLEHSKSRLIQKAESGLPLLLLNNSGLLNRLLDTAQSEEKAIYSQHVYEDVKKQNSDIMEILKTNNADNKIFDAIKGYISTKETELLKNAKTNIVINLSSEGSTLLKLLKEELKELKKETEKDIKSHHEITTSLEKAKTELASVPDKNELSELIYEIEEKKKSIHLAENEINKFENELKSLHFQLERKQSEYKKALNLISHRQIQNLDQERLINYAQIAAEVTNKYKHQIIKKHIKSIQENVLSCYQTLLRKEGLIQNVNINPETFEIMLYQHNDKAIHPDDLSAGERQILAISILWGLAKTAGRALPTAIDTPMGRLDTIHRTKLITRYFPNASHQVILLSTDEEITGKYLADLEPYISKKYILDYDNNTNSTHIKNGYFHERGLANVA